MQFAYFDYQRYRSAPRQLLTQPDQVRDAFNARADHSNGYLYGCFRSMVGLGLARDEGIAVSAWRTETEARAAPENGPGERVIMRATLRPTKDGAPDKADGLYVFRWFKVLDSNWNEFASLSDEAWPNMEGVFGTQIFGFWRSLDSKDGIADVLLLTWYANLATWEASRWWNKPVEAAQASMSRFRRRNDLIEDTIAYPVLFIPA